MTPRGGETSRICDLPWSTYDPDPDWSRRFRRHAGAPDLLDAQTMFLQAAEHAAAQPTDTDSGPPGVLGLMSCGSGKTLALQLAPHVFRAKRPLLILPASLLGQLERDVTDWSRHFKLACPRTLTYGKLSHPSGQSVLDELRPDLIMLDEAHLLGRGARMKRLWGYVDRYRWCRVAAVTGSLTNSSVYDMDTLTRLCLRDWSPLPFTRLLDQWASVLDVGGEPAGRDRQAFRAVQEWAATGGGLPEPREAFQRRLWTCPGVVITTGPLDVGPSLALQMVEPPPTPELDVLEERWELPDGTMLVDAIEVWRHRRTLRLGFYYRWDPETVQPEWLKARSVWGKVVRDHVEYGGYDTPYFVERAAKAGQLRPGALSAWARWCETRDTYDPPVRETVWVSEVLREMVDAWRADHPEGLVWYHSRAVEEALDGMPVHRAGESPPVSGFAVCSLAHSKGWNGQSYNKALVLEPPMGADHMEQLLARHHRRGQTQDVRFWLVGSARERGTIRARARYVRETTGTPQRFLIGDWVDNDEQSL